jgi:peptidoglycan-associated lipoprotein
MKTPRPLGLFATASLTVVLAACGTTKLPEPASNTPVETRSPVAATPAAGAGAAATPTPQSQVSTVDLSKDAAAGGAGAALLAMPTQRVVYFDFDSFVIKDDFKPLLDGYAKVLSTNKGKKLVVEGHTDERGGREYNLALGQKRAAAVVKSLTLLGATDGQLEAVSFGEERPAAQGNDESAWSKNRRAELKDR